MSILLLKSTKTSTNYYPTCIKDCIQEIDWNSGSDSESKSLVCSILGLVIDVEVVETDTSFLTAYQDNC